MEVETHTSGKGWAFLKTWVGDTWIAVFFFKCEIGFIPHTRTNSSTSFTMSKNLNRHATKDPTSSSMWRKPQIPGTLTLGSHLSSNQHLHTYQVTVTIRGAGYVAESIRSLISGSLTFQGKDRQNKPVTRSWQVAKNIARETKRLWAEQRMERSHFRSGDGRRLLQAGDV